MEIKHRENTHKGSFYIEENDVLLAEITYSFAGSDKLILDHTIVGKELKGMGIGNMLVEAAVSYSRDKGIKIVPLCPFAKTVFEKNPSYKDVLLK